MKRILMLLFGMLSCCIQSNAQPGTADLTFNGGLSGPDGEVLTTAVQSDGKLIIAGNFSSYSGVARNDIARINPDGSIDQSFDAGTNLGISGQVQSVAIQSDGKILVAGIFNTISGFRYLFRLNTDGNVDNTFNPFFSSSGSISGSRVLEYISKIIIQPDSKIIIVTTEGDALGTNGLVCRLQQDGSFDESFLIITTTGAFNTAILQPDGRIIIGGYFQGYSGYSSILNTTTNIPDPVNIIRVLDNGDLDAALNFNRTGVDGFVDDICLQPNGKILVGCSLVNQTGNVSTGIVRLESNGTIDPGFNPGPVIPNGTLGIIVGVQSILLQNDGRIIIGGGFNNFIGTNNLGGLARLNADGTVDNIFSSGTGVISNGAGVINDMTFLSTGQMLIGGNFPSYAGNTNLTNLARINTSCVQPTINIVQPQQGIACLGTTFNFTSTISVGGANPVYQWKVNGNNAGSNSSTFSIANWANGDIITCTLTSNDPCASPSDVTSNAITLVAVTDIWYFDEDNDGFYTGSPVNSCIYPGTGYVSTVFGGGDCDDNNNQIYPGANEIPGNGIDDNCNGQIDEVCTPLFVSACFLSIESVTLNTLVNANNGCNNSYTDFTGTHSLTIEQGGVVNFSIAQPDGSLNQKLNIYVDYNQNSLFTDPGEQVVTDALLASGSPATGSFIIPLALQNGNYRLRVIADYDIFSSPEPCFTNYGEAEDYNLNVYTQPVYCTASVDQPCVFTDISQVQIGSMINNTSGNCLTGYTDYSAANYIVARPGNTLNYEVQTSTGGYQQNVNIYADYNNDGDFNDPGEQVASGIYDGFVFATGSFSIPALQAPGTYRLRVISTGINDPAEPCHSTTGEAEDYTLLVVANSCTPFFSNPCSAGVINNVIIGVEVNGGLYGTLLNYSTCNGYTVYPPIGEMVTKAAPGSTIGIQVETQSPFYARVDAFLDLNGNGDFNDPGEHIMNSGMEPGTVAYQTFVIPSSQTPGQYRLRIIAQKTLAAYVDPCFSDGGEIEDYTLIVTPCVPFTGTLSLAPGNPSAICEGGTTDLQIVVPNAAESFYSFNFANGMTSVGVIENDIVGNDMVITIPVSPTINTTYTIDRLTDIYGCPGTYNGTVTINVGTLNITPSATITQPTCAIPTGTITLDPPSGTGYSYSIGGAYQSSPVFSNLPPGDYTLSLQNSGGCVSSETTTVTINDQPLPPAAPGSVSGLVNVCAYVGTGALLGYKVTPDPNASGYQWTVPPTVSIINGQGTDSITVTIGTGFLSSPNKLIKVRALSTCGNSSEKFFYLAAQLPSTPSPITASSANSCQSIANGTPITYTIPKVPGATSYSWSGFTTAMQVTHPNGAGINDTLVEIVFLNTLAPVSVISVRSVNDCGTSGARSFTINRNPPSTPGLISGPTNICPFIAPNGGIATYSVSAVSNATGYAWILPNNVTDIAGQGTNTISFKYPATAISETISVFASNGCGSSVSPRSLSVTRLNPATPGIIDVIQVQSCPNRRYSYTLATMPSNASSVLWTVPVGATLVSGNGTTSILVDYPPTAVNGVVTVTGVSNCGNSTTRSVQVKLPVCPPSFTGKGESLLSDNIILSEQPFSADIFPNPTHSSFRIKTSLRNKGLMIVTISDVQGKIIRKYSISGDSMPNMGEDLIPGVYYIEIQTGIDKVIRKLVRL